jgi:Cellulase (glycosyl hydrolase family 5)
MLRRPFLIVFCLGVLACGVPAAAAAAPRMLVGAAEDAAKQPDLVTAKAKMDLAQLAGFNAIRLTTIWAPGQTQPSAGELQRLQNAAEAADLDGITIILAVYQWGGATTPRTPLARTQFATFCAALATGLPNVRHFIVGNEPNVNRFWWPQFGPRGQDLAARDYELMLATSYDALKAVNPELIVIGGSVSPHGGDDPNAARKTHSPTTFIPDMGRYYRASHRTKPIMDAFDFHPYPDRSKVSPGLQHPRTTTVALADYRKLVSLLHKAFDGTAQLGSRLPIYDNEFGVQSIIPAAHQTAYTNLTAPSAADAVSEQKQAASYRYAIALAYCQPTVVAFLIFHVSDESDLDRWQSGVYYADDQPKSSLASVRNQALAARQGLITGCVRFPKGSR